MPVHVSTNDSYGQYSASAAVDGDVHSSVYTNPGYIKRCISINFEAVYDITTIVLWKYSYCYLNYLEALELRVGFRRIADPDLDTVANQENKLVWFQTQLPPVDHPAIPYNISFHPLVRGRWITLQRARIPAVSSRRFLRRFRRYFFSMTVRGHIHTIRGWRRVPLA